MYLQWTSFLLDDCKLEDSAGLKIGDEHSGIYTPVGAATRAGGQLLGAWLLPAHRHAPSAGAYMHTYCVRRALW